MPRRKPEPRFVSDGLLVFAFISSDFANSVSIKVDGQFNFCSGWEWSYWLSDVITARAAWDPKIDIENQQDALTAILQDALQPLGPASSNIVNLISQLVAAERAYLIEGFSNSDKIHQLEFKLTLFRYKKDLLTESLHLIL